MSSYLKNNNGFGLIGILMAVLVIAVMSVGSFYFFNVDTSSLNDNGEKTKENIIDVYEGAKEDVKKINQKTEDRNNGLKESRENSMENSTSTLD